MWGPRSLPRVFSATSTGSREHMASACAVVRYATPVTNTADFLCANSSLCQVVVMMIDVSCTVMAR